MQTPIGTGFPQGIAGTGSGTASGTVQAAISGQARALALPPALTQTLASGQAVNGEVTARPAAGQVTVTTALGAVQLQTALALPQNAAVSLQLVSAGPPATLQIQAITPAQAAELGGGQVGGRGTGQAGSQARGQAGAQAGAQSAATAGTPAGPSVVTSLTQGAVVQATLVSSASAGQGAAGTATASTSAAAAASQPAAAQLPGAPAGTVLPPHGTVPVRILEFVLPGQGTLSATAGAGAQTGTVSATGAGGASIVQTPFGTLSLATPQPLPLGTLLSFELAGAVRAPGDAVQGSFNLERWSGLKEAMSLVQQGDPAAAQRILQSIVPQPGPQLGASMLFFLSALRGGGLDRLLGGDGMKALDRAGGRGAASRADGDLTGAVGRARDSGGGDWRAYSLPIQQGGDLDTLRLYVRGEREEADGEEGAGGGADSKRFIIEANFSRLGPFQFDGLVREKKIDLMVRTHGPLEDGMRDDIRALFADTTSALGLDGRVDFHVVKAFDVVLEETLASPARPGVTV